jgi:hypothetical protein
VRIGIDFDNTIVAYGALFSRTAIELGYLNAADAGGKTAVRDAVRRLPDGERKWRRLQAIAYGPKIADATLFPGVHAFLARARAAGAAVYLVSHISRFAAGDPGGVDLRVAATGWLRAHGLVGPDAFEESALFFEGTRAEKVARLAALACTHVIDDLAEVFSEPGFPAAERLLFAPDGGPAGPWQAFASWDALRGALFPNG